MTMPALVLDRVSRRYGPVAALSDVSLTVTGGEVIALVGHSGSGKSTLLRLVAGLERPTAGAIAIAGEAVSDGRTFVPPEARGVGMVFQDYALFPHLNLRDNLRFGLARLPAREAGERVSAALRRIGLADRGDAYPHMLSGGEQQRVALARALLPSPRILLMDEPFSNLDARTRDRIRAETASTIRAAGITSILVTHDPEDAMRIADRIMLMAAGRILRVGTTEELRRDPRSLPVARFMARFNEIAARVVAGELATPLGRFAAPGLADGTAVVVCIRPRDLRLVGPEEGATEAAVAGCFSTDDGIVLSLAVPGLADPLEVHAPDGAKDVGQRVFVRPERSEVIIVPAE